jgi:hypothetical protein
MLGATEAGPFLPCYVGDVHVELQMARYNMDNNSIERTLVHLRSDGMKFVSVTDTYASPGELDITARVTGFRRVSRYGAWDGAVFTVASTNCVSVYQLQAYPRFCALIPMSVCSSRVIPTDASEGTDWRSHAPPAS